MALNSMYENLMQLPLFNGMSYNRISEIVGNTKLAFLKYLDNETIVSAGDPCTQLMFVIGGKVKLTINNINDRFRVTQVLSAPSVVFPDFLFGRNTLYPATVTAMDTVSLLEIAKNDFISIAQSDEVCLYNYLNFISTNAQKAIDGVIALTSGSLEERIAFWIIALTQRDATDITLSCRQRDLYTLFGVQRSSFISTLDSMKEKGLIEYSTNEIKVISRRNLRSILLKAPD
ncbi:MAG: Crp/Fnr family transcriptional regulator [Duncaniella sp.]|nr:Crp/Fnr family transcriptional regulator [Duncaniella sp.]MDE6859988.1 Crp/Fnr family transcriptional regulator [Duncaniella sp.]MDE7145652.1 Crp/Fnr family transcriptional regulator [Duncaniella sp.]